MQEVGGSLVPAGTHISQYQNAAALQLMKSERSSLVVRACGRSVVLPDGIASVGDIQGVLQVELGMRDQVFEVYNSDGMQCLNDNDIYAAVAEGRLPFTATLSDASIHFIENRREELAQMQWKLMRDQQSQMNLKISSVCRQVSELVATQEQERRDRELQCDKMQNEFYSAIDALREQARCDFRQLEERVAGVSHLISAERNLREAAVQRIMGDLVTHQEQSNVDRSAVVQAHEIMTKNVDDATKQLHQERQLRDAFEERHRLEMDATRERMDEMTNGLQHVINDYSRSFEKATQEINEMIETQSRTHHKGRSELEQALLEAMSKLATLETRQVSLETRTTDTQKRHDDMLERLNTRNEKVNQSCEVMRFEVSKEQATTNTLAQRMSDYEDLLKHTKNGLSDQIGHERRRREDEFRSLRDAMITEHGTLVADLETRIAQRLERESAAREGTVTDILNGVSDSLRKELPVLMGGSIKDDISERGTIMPASSPGASPGSRPTMMRAGTVPAMPTVPRGSLGSNATSGLTIQGPGYQQMRQGQTVASYQMPTVNGASTPLTAQMVSTLPATATATATPRMMSAHSTPTVATPRAVTPQSRSGSVQAPVGSFAFMPRTNSQQGLVVAQPPTPASPAQVLLRKAKTEGALG